MYKLDGKYRLLMKTDFDALVSAIIFKKMQIEIEDIIFVRAKDLKDGIKKVEQNDITVDLPYVKGIFMGFDHHLSESIRLPRVDNFILDINAASTARIIYEYFKNEYDLSTLDLDMLYHLDKADTANFTVDDILNPKGWFLFNFILDPRTWLDKINSFGMSSTNFMRYIINVSMDKTINDILNLECVKDRINAYFDFQNNYIEQIKRCSKVIGDLLVVDLRNETNIYPGNRFMPYVLFPYTNIFMHIMPCKNKKSVFCSLGKSILKKESKINVGLLMLEHGGIGYESSGVCEISSSIADEFISKMIDAVISLN